MRCGILGAGRSARRYRGGCARFSARPERGRSRRACGFGVSDRLREARSVAPVLVHIHEPQVKAAKYTHLFQCVDPIFTREIRAPKRCSLERCGPKRRGLGGGRPEAARSQRGGRGGSAEGCARRGGPQGKAGGARKGAHPRLAPPALRETGRDPGSGNRRSGRPRGAGGFPSRQGRSPARAGARRQGVAKSGLAGRDRKRALGDLSAVRGARPLGLPRRRSETLSAIQGLETGAAAAREGPGFSQPPEPLPGPRGRASAGRGESGITGADPKRS